MKFTIFTPTYNRAYILPKLYNSLLKQTSLNFEWLIIDDGSTDETEQLIGKYIKESKITIRYYKQKNSGKHIAINRALQEAAGEYLITVDSDDYLEDNAVEVCEELSKKVEDKTNFAGFTFIHCSDKIEYNKEDFGKKEWTEIWSYQWPFKGEMSWVFKMDIIKNYPFPVYEGEKFCQESVILLRVIRKYKVLFTDYILAHGDYLEDGLSQKVYQRMLENPRYAKISLQEKFLSAKNDFERKDTAKKYWDIAMKTGGGFWKNIGGISLYWTWMVFKEKMIKKLF